LQFTDKLTDKGISAFQPPLKGSLVLSRCKEQMEKWITGCESQHDHCSEEDGIDKTPPTRLLHITTSDHSIHVRLVSSQTISPAPRYATLSYCWGLSQPLKLHAASVADFERGLELHVLPKTFQHAISTCIGLGIDFIWIDSLCIIQDSRDDWEHEAFKMAATYINSTLNIAAAASADSSGGLFREEALSQTLCVQATWSGFPAGVYLIVDFENTSDSISQNPLSLRAWALQEAFLARRTLYFAKGQVWWTCRSVEWASEQFPLGAVVSSPARSMGRMPLTWNRMLLGRDSPSRINLWYDLVEEYTQKTLSVPSDRPFAIVGIAQAIAAVYDMSMTGYVAGHWLESFVPYLLWSEGVDPLKTQPVHFNRTLSANANRGQPSWSWLTSQQSIRFQWGSVRNRLLCEITLSTSTNGGSGTASTTADSALNILKVNGPLVETNSARRRMPNHRRPWLDLPEFRQAPEYQSDDDNLEFDSYVQHEYHIDAHVQTSPGDDTTWIGCLVATVLYGGHNYSGLMLVPVPGRAGYFARIGMVNLRACESIDNWLNEHKTEYRVI
jgi:hypothetical protein